MTVHGIPPIATDGARSLSYCGERMQDGDAYTVERSGMTCEPCMAQHDRRALAVLSVELPELGPLLDAYRTAVRDAAWAERHGRHGDGRDVATRDAEREARNALARVYGSIKRATR